MNVSQEPSTELQPGWDSEMNEWMNEQMIGFCPGRHGFRQRMFRGARQPKGMTNVLQDLEKCPVEHKFKFQILMSRNRNELCLT